MNKCIALSALSRSPAELRTETPMFVASCKCHLVDDRVGAGQTLAGH